MQNSFKKNIFYSPSINLTDAIIDEVALEGLDGITLEALWTRLAARLQMTGTIHQALKEQIWMICISIKEFSFYELPEARPPLVLYDRYEFVDPDLGTIIEPENLPDDIYEYFPIDDVKNGVKGSCKFYHTRKKIESIRSLNLESIEIKYGSKLVIVASQAARQYALIGDCVCPTIEWNITQFCLLERVGRSRYHGEITQGKRSLSVLKEDPKTSFYHRKLLLKHKLITKQMHYQKYSGHGTSGSLLHLPRFYVERKPKMFYLAEKIIELLKSRETHLADYVEIKKVLGIENSIKNLFKMAFFQRVVKTDLIVPYRTLYPEAESSEWQRKNSPLHEKKVRAVQLIDSSIDINELWIKEDGMDDEELFELDTSNQILNQPLLHQANLIMEQAQYNGLSQNELAIIMGLTKLQARTILRNLLKVRLVATYMNDIGRQRITKYVSKKFEKNSDISKQFRSEMDKMKELTKQAINEKNNYKAPCTSEEFFYPTLKTDTTKEDSKEKNVEPMVIVENENLINRRYLFSIVNGIKKKYKLSEKGFKYNVTCQNVKTMKDLSKRLNKSNKTHSIPRKRLKLMTSTTNQVLESECDVELQESKVLDNTVGFRCSIKDLNLYDTKNTGALTYRILKRANMIIEAVKEHKVIDELTKLMKLINEEEEREGYDVKMDKKSLIRVLQKLSADNLVKNIKLTLSANGATKTLTFICDPSINIEHTVIQSAVEQAKIKFCLTTSKCKPSLQSNDESKNDESSTSKRTVKCRADANLKVIPTNLVMNTKAGKDYGYSPKFIRMKILHQLLFYLSFEHPGIANVSKTEQIERLRNQGHQIDAAMEKEMTEIYDTQVGWRMFVPPLPIHNGWPLGWALFCDVLLRIPLSIFLKIYNVPFIIPDLDYYIKNPIRKNYLVKDLPTPLRNALLMKRRYIYSIHETISRLCFIGLVQFGPQKLKEKDQVFIYLNRRAELMDTSSSAASYHQIEEKEYPTTNYFFDKMQTVEKYWYDMWHICINTRLGGRLAVQGTDIILEELTKKVEMLQTLKPKAIQEVASLDLGKLPGDKKGAAGIDSAFFSHLKRNWNWENFKNSYDLSLGDSEIRYHNIQRKTHLSKIQSKPIKFTEFSGLKKVTGPRSVDINELKEMKKPQRKLMNSTDKLSRIKLIQNKVSRKQNTIVRRVLPRKRKTRCRVKYDDIDYSALQKMDKLRVDWNPREDNILLVCKVVMMYLAPNPRSQLINFTAVRDVLRLYSQSSYNKTSRACQRRLLYMLKQPQTIHSVALGVEEMKQNYFVNKRYGDIVEKIRKANDPNECDEKMATVFKNLVAYVAKKYYDISQTESKKTKYKPSTIQEFNLLYDINYPQEPHSNQGFTNDVKSTTDIHTATINSVIYSSMCCGKDRKSWAYQLFRIYQQYPEILLRNAMGKIRSDQMVSIKRNYVSAMKKYGNCMPMSSSQYQLSTTYLYKFHSKLPMEIYSEIQNFFSKIFDSYVNRTLDPEGGGVQIFPPTGGMIVAIQECLTQNKLDFDIKIPDHVITLLDPKLQEYDETYNRIAKRYQDILASLKQRHSEYEQIPERLHQENSVSSTRINTNIQLEKKKDVQEQKTRPESTALTNKPSAKKSSFKREHWGWGLSKTQRNGDVNEESSKITNCNLIDDEFDCVQFQDGTMVKITQEDIDRAQSTVIDDSIHQAFLKTHPHLANDFLDKTSIESLNQFVDDIPIMEINFGDPIINQCSVEDETTNKATEEEKLTDDKNSSNFVNNIIADMKCEIESSSLCCKKDVNTDDVHKSCTRIALLKMREELNEDLPDSHHAHEYFVVSTFGIYYSLSNIDAKHYENPEFTIDDKIINDILLSDHDNYKNIIRHLKKFALFPKDFPDFLRIRMDLEKTENIPPDDVDLIYNYIRDKREQGATLKELKSVLYAKIGTKLFDILHYMTNYRVLLRTGVTEVHYVHHHFIDPWIIHSIRIMRLQREGLPPIPPGSVYVLNSNHNDKISIDNATTSNDNDITINDNATISNDNAIISDDKNTEGEISLSTLLDSNSQNITSTQKNIRKNRRTCLLQTKDIYTAAKQLDLNTAEDIEVVIRPWIQIDGVINRSMLEKMLGAILSHCIINAGILLSQIQMRFIPALQPYHTRELVELLVKLQCLQFKVLSKIPSNLFSKAASMRLSYPARMDGISACDNELVVETVPGAILKFSTFLSQYHLHTNTKLS